MMESVYVIAADTLGAVKVGYAKNVQQRLRGLQCGNPFLLRVAYVARFQHARRVEEFAHIKLAKWRGRGEWFWCEPAVAVEGIRDAAVRVGDIPDEYEHTLCEQRDAYEEHFYFEINKARWAEKDRDAYVAESIAHEKTRDALHSAMMKLCDYYEAFGRISQCA